jgi:uncharacterized protein (DUF849 family)
LHALGSACNNLFRSTPVIITVAITGAVPRKKDNPAVPVTPAEQIESTHEAFEAGASPVHIHVRNPDESSGSDPERFARVQERVRKHCPGMIVQFSTGGRGRTGLEDNLRIAPDRLAASNAELVKLIVDNCAKFDRRPATPADARKILGLRAAA